MWSARQAREPPELDPLSEFAAGLFVGRRAGALRHPANSGAFARTMGQKRHNAGISVQYRELGNFWVVATRTVVRIVALGPAADALR